MLNLQQQEAYEETVFRLKGFAVLLGSEEVRGAMNLETATGLEYIMQDIIEGFERIRTALNRKN